MGNLSRLPYEISLWDDRLALVDSAGNEYMNFADASQIEVASQYYKEVKLCVIGSHQMEGPTRIVEPNLARKTDGTNTLTFSIYAKYYDEELGQMVDNPFVQYLTNERKVKLKHYPNGQMAWMDFVIKKVDENSDTYKFTYTATDLFINELSKSGYDLVFDMELENNQGPIHELANKVLAQSDWGVGTNTELIRQTSQEALYKIALSSELIAYDVLTEEMVSIPAGENVYAFYSDVEGENFNYFQFMYDAENNYKTDQDNVAHGANYYCAIASLNDLGGTPVYCNDFRGEKLCRTQESTYDPVLKKYVKIYGNGAVYGYTESKYITPAMVENYVTNGLLITSASGWMQTDPGSLVPALVPSYEENNNLDTKRLYALQWDVSAGTNKLINTGFRDSIDKIGEIALNDEFIFRVKGGVNKNFDANGNAIGFSNLAMFNWYVQQYSFNEKGEIIIDESSTLLSGVAFANSQDGEGYYYSQPVTPTRALSLEELKGSGGAYWGIVLAPFPGGQYCYIQEMQLFRHAKDEDGATVLPNGNIIDLKTGEITQKEFKAYVEQTYYYYDSTQEVTDPEQIQYLYIGKEDVDIYEPQYRPGCEKIRSISAKESNRFNILQNLSETFECWCRFNVLHKETGEILLEKDYGEGLYYDANGPVRGGTPLISEKPIDAETGLPAQRNPYDQYKFVTFHKEIGQKKSIGFAYGRNLKSITRNLDSNNISSKLIVKNNANEHANGGMCSIARAPENPTKENIIYDFSHYIKQGLLNYNNLYNDLYVEDESKKWIGVLSKLQRSNAIRDGLVIQQSEMVGQYSHFKSEEETNRLKCDSAKETLFDQITYFFDLTKISYDDFKKMDAAQLAADPNKWHKNQKVIATITDIQRLQAEIELYETSYTKAQTELLKVEEELEKIKIQLEEIAKATSKAITDFERKYGRFIQESSWISEEYVDDSLYFFDAESTLHKSATPKVTYTINPIELSRVEGYENYTFDLGDISYVQDTEFFGWTYVDGIKTPYREEIVITELTTYFDEPNKNKISAKNYRDTYDDIFQRMTATVQQLQLHSGAYDRAADVVNGEGAIKQEALADAFTNNSNKIANTANQSVTWDERGLITTNISNPAEITRVASGGIFLTEDGGQTWTTGITPQGINAKMIKTGELDAGVVTISSGSEKAFRWDAEGISAYKDTLTNGTVARSAGTYVRYDQYGLYGITDKPNFIPDKADPTEHIQKESNFSLTWDGLTMKKGFISLKDDNGIGVLIDPQQLKSKDGVIFEINTQNGSVVKITDDGSATFAGTIQARDGAIGAWEITKEGIQSKAGTAWIAPEGKGINEGTLTDPDNKVFALYVKGENKRFGVTPDGVLYATGADLEGTIKAKDGYIGNWLIDTDGFVYKNNNEEKMWIRPTGGKGVTLPTGSITNAAICVNNSFAVTTDGKVYATGGNIGGWQLTDNGFEKVVQTKARAITSNSNAWFAPQGKEGTVNGNPQNFVLYTGGNFGVTSEGFLYTNAMFLNGNIYVEGEANIARWKFDDHKFISTKTDGSGYNVGEQRFVGIYTAFNSGDGNIEIDSTGQIVENGTKKNGVVIAGHPGTDWRLIIGHNFGVDWDGTVYAKGGEFIGKIEAEEGRIGSWIIDKINLGEHFPNYFPNSQGEIQASISATGAYTRQDGGGIISYATFLTGAGIVLLGYTHPQQTSSATKHFIPWDKLISLA